VNNVDEFGNAGGATLVRCVLQKAWIPTGRPEPPNCFDEFHPQIPRLAAFLEAQLHARSPQTSAPRYEFVDDRNSAQSAEAFAWAESHQQYAQAPQKSSVSSRHIFFGLWLTLVLHALQLLLLTLLKKKVEAYFYAGFTQLLYMLPAIYLSRPNRGLMIGLIIGAALTFMLGLPLAALAYICGNMSAY
jgi:hypothetical protein